MQITVFRNRFQPTRTVGQLYIDGEFFCFTLEDKVRPDPNPETPENEGKVYGETAIPAGTYKVGFVNSPSFGPDTLTLYNVPGYQHIRIHSGNTEDHTKGCIIVGYRLNDDGTVRFGSTKPALADLKKRIKKALQEGQKVTISIINYPAPGR